MTDFLHEQGFNYALARVLRECDSQWNDGNIRCERVGGGGREDIVVDVPGLPPVVIECAYGGDDGKDARARLADGERPRENAIAVAIPDEFRAMSEVGAEEALRAGTAIGYAAHQADWQFPARGHIEGSVRDLVDFLPVGAVSKTRMEEVANEVVRLIKCAAKELNAGLSETDIADIAGLVVQRSPMPGLHTTCVLWLDALLVQHAISQSSDEVAGLPSFAEHVSPIELTLEWRKNLKTNWRSVFEPAVLALEAAAKSYRQEVQAAVKHLLRAVEVIHGARLDRYINVGAELFPKIIDEHDRKNSAAFYTTPATAELLAGLLLREQDHDWARPQLFAQLNIADFACGTGSLLRAALQRVVALHMRAAGAADAARERLYQDAMEGGLTGADVSPIATHLTISSLVMSNPGVAFGRTNIGTVGVGAPDRVGSLEFIQRGRMANDLLGNVLETRLGGDDGEAAAVIDADDEAFDYVIMNPPYSRTSGGGGTKAFDIAGMDDAEREACQKRWGKLAKGTATSKVAGMATTFLCIARNKLKPGGKLAFVLNAAMAFGSSWEKVRAMLVTEFEDIIALTVIPTKQESHLSADTSIGEILLVATKRAQPGARTSVLCGLLKEPPKLLGVAGAYARAINEAATRVDEHGWLRAGESELGVLLRYHPVSDEDAWSHLAATNTDLAVVAETLSHGGIRVDSDSEPSELAVPMTGIGELFTFGANASSIGYVHQASKEGGGTARGALRLVPIRDASDTWGAHRSLWHANGKANTAMIVLPTHKGEVRSRDTLARVRDTQGKLHYQLFVRWNSQQLLVATTARKVYGGKTWLTLLHDDARVRDAFALWANSTFGIFVHWTRGARNMVSSSIVAHHSLAAMPCPDLTRLDAAALQQASREFKRLSDAELKPLGQLHADPVRHEIDLAVMRMLGIELDESDMDFLRKAFATEPSVHGNQPGAVALLRRQGLMD